MSTPLRVLMVEDSEDSCVLIAGELQRHGYEPIWVRVDTADGMRGALDRQKWEVIIADFMVPQFDALTSLRLAQDLAPDLPFIVVSGNLGEEVAVAVMKAGAQDYVTKGNLARLVPAIERELREAETRAGRRRTEVALRQSEAHFRAVVESLGEGLLLTDLSDSVWYANSRMAELTGYEPAEMFRRPVSAFLRYHRDVPGAESRRPPSAASERIELELVRKDGTPLWTEVNAAPLRDSDGRSIGTVRAITDITERRQAREALRKSQASLLLAQRIGHVGSWDLDLASRKMDWSSETYRIFDVAPEAARTTLDGFLAILDEADRPRVRHVIDQALEQGNSCRADARLTRLDGAERHVHIQAQVILNAQDQPVQMIGTVQDITERKLLEEQLRHSQKMEAVGQLAGGIAHDFNNILTVIQGYTELITYQPNLEKQTRTYASQIAVSAERASKLTRQLLAFSRKQLMQLKSIDLNQLLNNLASMLQRLLGERINLQLNTQADLPAVVADAGMVEQVLVNLVVNARDAMPKGGRLILETSLHQIDPDYCRIHPEASPGQFLCLGVIDTGCGMDTRTLNHLFEPFFTTKEVGRGTGLGLSTVYGIVKQHQGWIQVASEVGRGSAFKVFLPITAPSNSTAPSARETPLVEGGTETILLVEDEPPLRQLARSVLERHGYTVLEAGSGPEALTVWNESRADIDMLLTDMVMPGGITGRELAVQLQGQDPSLRVLYTSGYSLDFVESDLLFREGVNFVPKPYSGTALGQAVRACLDRKH